MSAPFIFVASYKVRGGQFEDYKPWVKELCRFVESKEPRMIALNIYADGTEVTAIQVHPEAGSMKPTCKSSAITSSRHTATSWSAPRSSSLAERASLHER